MFNVHFIQKWFKQVNRLKDKSQYFLNWPFKLFNQFKVFFWLVNYSTNLSAHCPNPLGIWFVGLSFYLYKFMSILALISGTSSIYIHNSDEEINNKSKNEICLELVLNRFFFLYLRHLSLQNANSQSISLGKFEYSFLNFFFFAIRRDSNIFKIINCNNTSTGSRYPNNWFICLRIHQ